MADDRALEEPVDQIGRLQAELDDLKSTLLARLSRRPTGDVEAAIRSTPKPNTLICNGQVVSRTQYPDLWAWAQEQGLVTGKLFGSGDNSTTFSVPDLRGAVLVGAGQLGSDVYTLGSLVGAATKVLTVANLPAHDHNVTVAAHATHQHNVDVGSHPTHQHTGSATADGSHAHGGNTGSGGNHGGHFPGTSHNAAAGNDLGLAAWNSGGSGGGTHTHSIGTDTEPAHTHAVNINASGPTTHNVAEAAAGPTTHTVTEQAVGSGAPVDVRQPGVPVNFLIWV